MYSQSDVKVCKQRSKVCEQEEIYLEYSAVHGRQIEFEPDGAWALNSAIARRRVSQDACKNSWEKSCVEFLRWRVLSSLPGSNFACLSHRTSPGHFGVNDSLVVVFVP